MIKCLRARRGNVHRKQNCFRGVLLFKTHFAEFCVKYVCKTMPWNWAVTITWSRLNNEQQILYVKIGKLVNSFANYSYCYYIFQVAGDLCLSLKELSRKTG